MKKIKNFFEENVNIELWVDDINEIEFTYTSVNLGFRLTDKETGTLIMEGKLKSSEYCCFCMQGFDTSDNFDAWIEQKEEYDGIEFEKDEWDCVDWDTLTDEQKEEYNEWLKDLYYDAFADWDTEEILDNIRIHNGWNWENEPKEKMLDILFDDYNYYMVKPDNTVEMIDLDDCKRYYNYNTEDTVYCYKRLYFDLPDDFTVRMLVRDKNSGRKGKTLFDWGLDENKTYYSYSEVA